MSNINRIQDTIISEFNVFDQWIDKYQYLIDLSTKLPPIDAKFKCDENLIRGCQSRVWLYAEITDNLILFFSDSDALITKGIISLLIRVLSNQQASHIIDADLYFIDRIGLKEHLSPTRSNGLVHMVNKIKSTAQILNRKN